jgi:hypothetical protein
MTQDDENVLFNLAAEVVQFTNCNLFLTGKAGTGKTTFLKSIREHTSKNTVVVAPTGVAAINAGGVTMHSFFQLPFIPYLPHETRLFDSENATVDRQTLIKNIRFNKQKLELIRELELLIIDEVSMLRADMLDAIDEILRHFRHRKNVPFGGVQVVLIGDLFQLPPVAGDAEWALMKEHYASPFFFSAKVIEKNPPLFIELKKIYRQKEEQFIRLLNNIRHNQMAEQDVLLLQSRYRPDAFNNLDKTITLTTHNHMADKINQHELQKLEGKVHRFDGAISGDFSEKTLPTEQQLLLKVGAQIMFLKNDPDPAKRYFNGKLATVKKLDSDKITVVLADSEEEMELEQEKWSNVRYVLNKENNKVEEEELGSFTQYPIRLAWAITIHKSQGLTFDKVVIDAGSSFAAGQVYVALSRCRTLDGIVLLSHIHPSSVKSDERIIQFSAQENSLAEIQETLAREKPKFAAQLLLNTFDWSKLIMEFQAFDELTDSKKLPEKDMLKGLSVGLLEQAKKQQDIADKFMKQLDHILGVNPIDGVLLNERVTKAKQYFAQLLHNELLQPLQKMKDFLKGKSKIKQYLTAVNEMEAVVWKKLDTVQRITFGEFTFEVPQIKRKETPKAAAKGAAKPAKGNSKLETLEFYKQGLMADAIAKQRGLALTTIEGHLAEFVATGEVNVFDLISEELIAKVEKAQAELGSEQLTPLKQFLGDEVSYTHIRFALNYLKGKMEKQVN